MELGTARSADKRFTHCAMGLLSLQKSLPESPGNDHEDAGEVRVLNEKMYGVPLGSKVCIFSGTKNNFSATKNNISGTKNNFSGTKNNFSPTKIIFSGTKINFSPTKINFSPTKNTDF